MTYPVIFTASMEELAGELGMTSTDLAPQAHVYFDTHVDWIKAFDDLPKVNFS